MAYDGSAESTSPDEAMIRSMSPGSTAAVIWPSTVGPTAVFELVMTWSSKNAAQQRDEAPAAGHQLGVGERREVGAVGPERVGDRLVGIELRELGGRHDPAHLVGDARLRLVGQVVGMGHVRRRVWPVAEEGGVDRVRAGAGALAEDAHHRGVDVR